MAVRGPDGVINGDVDNNCWWEVMGEYKWWKVMSANVVKVSDDRDGMMGWWEVIGVDVLDRDERGSNSNEIDSNR